MAAVKATATAKVAATNEEKRRRKKKPERRKKKIFRICLALLL